MDITTILGKWMHVYANDLPEIFEMTLANDLLTILDNHSAELSAADQDQLVKIFLRGCEYEFNFFDSAYHQKQWQYETLV